MLVMKTLDEVIEALEKCISDTVCVNECPYYKDGCLDHALDKDSLHYLKEYQAILPLVPNLINTALQIQKKGKTIG